MSEASSSTTRAGAFALVTLSYVLAVAAGVATLAYSGIESPLWNAFAADCVATVVIFAFSYVFKNSSFYDAYWSVIPPLLGVYFWLEASPEAPFARKALALSLCTLWGVRLTYNWARGWTGLHHEDWRYIAIREKTGPVYWLVSFLGIHFFPTVEVFAGCVGLFYALTATGPLGVLDAVATLVTLGAIGIETLADEQLRAFTQNTSRVPGSVLDTGLWRYSRHPNYFGEMTFWWGLFLFGYAAAPDQLGPMLIGPLAITLMFFFVSVPLIETRQLERKPAFADQIASTSMIIPWFRKG